MKTGNEPKYSVVISGNRDASFEVSITGFICPLKSELPKFNRDSFKSSDILIVDALSIAECEFSDTIRIKIGFDKGLTLKSQIFAIE